MDHKRVFAIPDKTSLAGLITHLLSIPYLPKIYGGEATWVLYEGDMPLAVVAQQWTRPHFLVDPDRELNEFQVSEGLVSVFFRYLVQIPPEQIVEALGGY